MKRFKQLEEAYRDATFGPYGYLLIDFRQDTPDCLTFRSRIIPDENIKEHYSPIIYVSK